jgi:hypothetical protein
MIKFQISRQSDHVSTMPPKTNKDKIIPDKKQRYQKMEQQMPRRRASFRYQNFFHGTAFTALILVIILQIVKLSLEKCN